MKALIQELALLDNRQVTVLQLTMLVARAKKILEYWEDEYN